MTVREFYYTARLNNDILRRELARYFGVAAGDVCLYRNPLDIDPPMGSLWRAYASSLLRVLLESADLADQPVAGRLCIDTRGDQINAVDDRVLARALAAVLNQRIFYQDHAAQANADRCLVPVIALASDGAQSTHWLIRKGPEGSARVEILPRDASAAARWTCSVHPWVTSNVPYVCPVCGMGL